MIVGSRYFDEARGEGEDDEDDGTVEIATDFVVVSVNCCRC